MSWLVIQGFLLEKVAERNDFMVYFATPSKSTYLKLLFRRLRKEGMPPDSLEKSSMHRFQQTGPRSRRKGEDRLICNHFKQNFGKSSSILYLKKIIMQLHSRNV